MGQLQSEPGFRGGRLRIDRHRAAWTVTLWDEASALARFRESHAPLMRRVDSIASSSAMTVWQQEGAAAPSFDEIARRWGAVPRPGIGFGRGISRGRRS